MNTHYADILSRIPEPPVWWDENAVPRYVLFSPMSLANIYAVECALVKIRCQNCHTEFVVAMSRSELDIIQAAGTTLMGAILDGTLHYGDPPNNECCPIGPTMNSEPLKVIAFWRRDLTHGISWVKDKSLEREFNPDADE